MKLYGTAFAVAGLLAVCGSANAAFFDFETTGQYSANFRHWAGSGVSQTTAQTSLGAANDSVKVDRTTGGGTSVVSLYDATPTNTLDAWDTFGGTITVSWDIATTQATTSSSFGVFFINPNTTGSNNNVLALMNVNFNAVTSAETMRFFVNGSLDGSSAGAVKGTAPELNVAPATGAFTNMLVTYTPATGVLTASAGGLTNSYTLTSAERNAVGLTPGVAFRVNDTDQWTPAAYFDNVSISVPEPTSMALASLVGMGLLYRRRTH